MRALLAPLLLLLGLASFITGFGILAFGMPEPGVAIHRARMAQDEKTLETEQQRLEQETRRRQFLVTGLFGSGILFMVAGFSNVKS